MPEHEDEKNREEVSQQTQNGDQGRTSEHPDTRYPEPPSAWQPPAQQPQAPGPETGRPPFINQGTSPAQNMISVNESEASRLEAARKLISIGQICAVVSLFFGGVLLSTVAVVLAIMGTMRLTDFANSRSEPDAVKSAIKRPGYFAVGLCLIALIVNIVSVVIFYPVVMQAVQSGDFSSIFTGGAGNGSAGAGNSTWG